MANNATLEKYCYQDNEANCDLYAGLYQWGEAMRYSNVPGTQGICPLGWHIATYNEYQTLVAVVNNNGNALKAVGQGVGGGQGTNTSGFTALLAGYRYTDGGFNTLGDMAYFWTSSEANSTTGSEMHLLSSNASIVFGSSSKVYGYSIRCVKD